MTTFCPARAIGDGPSQPDLIGPDLVIAHLGDLLAYQMAAAEAWRSSAVAGLTTITGLRAELATVRAEIARQADYIAGRDYEC